MRSSTTPLGRHLRRAIVQVVLIGLAATNGCVLRPAHVFGYQEDNCHPWHQWPAKATIFLVGAPMVVVLSPLIAVEELIDAPSFFVDGENSVSKVLFSAVTIGSGYVVGSTFLVAGLPLEFVIDGSAKVEDPRQQESAATEAGG